MVHCCFEDGNEISDTELNSNKCLFFEMFAIKNSAIVNEFKN